MDSGLAMSSLVRVLLLMMAGLAIGVALDTWPILDQGLLVSDSRFVAAGIDMISYATGLFVGMILWQIGSVQWAQLPTRMHQYFMEQMPIYRFLLMSGACLLVLIYF